MGFFLTKLIRHGTSLSYLHETTTCDFQINLILWGQQYAEQGIFLHFNPYITLLFVHFTKWQLKEASSFCLLLMSQALLGSIPKCAVSTGSRRARTLPVPRLSRSSQSLSLCGEGGSLCVRILLGARLPLLRETKFMAITKRLHFS